MKTKKAMPRAVTDKQLRAMMARLVEAKEVLHDLATGRGDLVSLNSVSQDQLWGAMGVLDDALCDVATSFVRHGR